MSESLNRPPVIGLVAGRGRYPLLFCETARRLGVQRIVVVAMRGETDESIADLADDVQWVHVGQIGKAIKILRKADVPVCCFMGQVKPGRLFGDIRPDLRAAKLLFTLKEKNAESIFTGIGNEFAKDGITVLPATTYLEEFLAREGQMGKLKLKKGQVDDMELGWRIAKEVSRMDIGQTVVVKNGTILAVEGFEGTDKCIKRGGELGKGSGITVVKVAKPGQDMRFDVPCIGTRTVESLKTAGASALIVEAGKTLFIDMPEVLAGMDAAGIAVVGCGAAEA